MVRPPIGPMVYMFEYARLRRAARAVSVLVALVALSTGTAAAQSTDEPPKSPETNESSNIDIERDLDDAWMRFHRAFLALAAGRTRDSAQMLRDLRADHPDHAGAVFAAAVLDGFEQHPEFAGRDLAVPEVDDEHPAIANEDSAVYDPNWATYREAFVRLAKGGAPQNVMDHLRPLRSDSSDHPVDALAEEVMSSLALRYAATTSDFSPELYETNPEPSTTWERVLVAGAGATFASALFGSVSGLSGTLLGVALEGGNVRNAAAVLGTLGAAAGGLTGIPIGVYLGGRAVGGNTAFAPVFWGALAGVLGDLLVVPILSAATRVNDFAGLALYAAPLPAIGALVAFENNHDPVAEPAESARVSPYLTPGTENRPSTVGLDIQF